VDSSPTRSVGQSFDPAARGVSRGSLLSEPYNGLLGPVAIP
jgi:hypothetical protein